MSNIITIAPCTRIEGEGKISLHLDDSRKITDARFHAVEFKSFEKFMEGRHIAEAPFIAPRMSAISSVSHHLAAAKACDNLFKVTIPPTAKLIRQLMHMGQFIHAHSLHLFYFAMPDIFFPYDSKKRNIFGMMDTQPEFTEKAIELRKCGQEIIRIITGRHTHPTHAVPGGVKDALTEEQKKDIETLIYKAKDLIHELVPVIKNIFADNDKLFNFYAPIKTHYVGLSDNGSLDLYDGKVIVDAPHKRLLEFPEEEYAKHFGEKVATWSYMKFPYIRNQGWPNGLFRVGPLARLNVSDKISTPLAQQELKEFRKFFNTSKQVHGTLQYHWARLVELVYAVEKAEDIINHPEIMHENIRQHYTIKAGSGVGVIEAPNGLLIHHYTCNDNGTIKRCNIIEGSEMNNGGINMSVKEAAKQYLNGQEITEPILNMIEIAVRAYGPTL